MNAPPVPGYRLVRLANGACSVHSLAHRETFHPVIGPVAEAEALYVGQLDLPARARQHRGEFVVWDVGLGAAANALTVLRATRDSTCPIRLLSFDCTLEPLGFALDQAGALGYFHGYEAVVLRLLQQHHTAFRDGAHHVEWTVHVADFPTLLKQAAHRQGSNVESPKSRAADPVPALGPRPSALGSEGLPKPHAILFDAFSPATNPEMWTLPLFTDLYRVLDPNRPCALPTYSRSTMLRVSLLLAGFYVGAGHATGEKEETTLAANTLELIPEPLDRRWLLRARRSTSAEPLWEPIYRQARLSPATWDRLQQHPQFNIP